MKWLQDLPLRARLALLAIAVGLVLLLGFGTARRAVRTANPGLRHVSQRALLP